MGAQGRFQPHHFNAPGGRQERCNSLQVIMAYGSSLQMFLASVRPLLSTCSDECCEDLERSQTAEE